MEKVWDALKKIEGKTDEIRTQAQLDAKEITDYTQKQADTLGANGKAYAEEEAKQLYMQTVDEANRKREEQLKANEKSIKELASDAQNRVDAAVLLVVNRVTGETQL